MPIPCCKVESRHTEGIDNSPFRATSSCAGQQMVQVHTRRVTSAVRESCLFYGQYDYVLLVLQSDEKIQTIRIKQSWRNPNSDPSMWRYFPDEQNVADEISRSISAKELDGRWQHGPAFLYLA